MTEAGTSQDNIRSYISFCVFQHFTRDIKALYQSGLEKVAFGKETEKTRELINSWVESHTQGRDA